jgi:hypothetical protein
MTERGWKEGGRAFSLCLLIEIILGPVRRGFTKLFLWVFTVLYFTTWGGFCVL